jgi:hypothetical protein
MSYLLGFIAFILKLCVLLYSVLYSYHGLETERAYHESRDLRRYGLHNPHDSAGFAVTFTLVLFWLIVADAYEWSDLSMWIAIFLSVVLSHVWGDYKRQFWDQ